jgi:hypothetical protein
VGARVAWISTTGTRWRCTRRRCEARGVNLDGGHAGGVDLDGGRAVEVHAEEEQGASVEAVDVVSRQTWRRSRR